MTPRAVITPASMPKSKKDINREKFSLLIESLSLDQEFCSVIQSSFVDRIKVLDDTVVLHATKVGYYLPLRGHPSRNFQSLLMRHTGLHLPESVRQLQKSYINHHEDAQHRRQVCQRIATRIGFKGNLKGLPNIPIKYLHRLSLGQEYPPTNYIVFENPVAPFPNKPKVIDPSCSHPRDFHRLNENKLAYTLEANDSAIFLDFETGELIAIIIRGLAKDYINIIQPWAVSLIEDSLNRRRLTQRNNPKMAQVGVSTGARSASLFGWVRNLFKRFQEASDKQQHEYNISSLFGIFYALLRAQVPFITDIYEDIMAKSEMPRLDQYSAQQFTLPIGNNITFIGHPLAPPEGYISNNYYKHIHIDKHWEGCPWAMYWNILREQAQGRVGKESGASFFVSQYGLRIINASNTCVAWDVSKPHGTGWYEGGVKHIGIATLLSKATQLTWQKYKQKVKDGDLQGDDLL